jgi:transposase-like protein
MEQNVSDIKYGLIFVDSNKDEENLDILNFCEYWNKPSKKDAEHLREELLNDNEFGLTDIVRRLDIIPAPDYIVKEFTSNID